MIISMTTSAYNYECECEFECRPDSFSMKMGEYVHVSLV